ncbi:hypothetical protein HII13_001070 [Brettanomyces bruxellensis]|uniref:Uncharacterized protein n=1 Tax=Dekkera bruxellensis TaxID=5007 RepID=A0A8H6EXI6_DEKBR|nr:hypothetical protein HII13_001070 [Brettanomyces bruxellensis]KAF6015846.1 hypothetical protein HII12_000408 [Brettanomyces bruxellensis]
MSTEQQALSYAAVILADADLELSSENLLKLTHAAGLDMDSVWGNIYAKALEGQDLKKLLINFNISSAAAAPAAASGAAAGEADAAEEDEEKKEESEEEEEDDVDMGMGLFD